MGWPEALLNCVQAVVAGFVVWKLFGLTGLDKGRDKGRDNKEQ